jgi:hypothetical protein
MKFGNFFYELPWGIIDLFENRRGAKGFLEQIDPGRICKKKKGRIRPHLPEFAMYGQSRLHPLACSVNAVTPWRHDEIDSNKGKSCASGLDRFQFFHRGTSRNLESPLSKGFDIVPHVPTANFVVDEQDSVARQLNRLSPRTSGTPLVGGSEMRRFDSVYVPILRRRV